MITEQKIIDKITILEDGQIEIREARRFIDNGEVVAQKYHRRVINPESNIDDEDQRVKALAEVDWTPERKAKYRQGQERRNRP